MLGDRVPQASPDGEQAGAPVLAAIPRRPAPLRGMPALPYPAVDEYAEAVRRLRTNLRFLSVDRPPRVLAVTSPRPGDGKTSIAVALAFSLAETGAEVALVDADLRRPAVADCLGLVQELGLTTVLAGQALLCDVVQEAERGATIKVVTGGALPPNPAELLGTGLFRQALKELAGTVDYVIVDTPPLGPVVDGLVLAPTIDGAIVVARPGVTRRTELDQAVRGLRSVGATVLGTVMNMARMPKDDYLPTWTRSGTTRPMLSIVVPRPRRRYSEADPQAVG
jgi:non-specific protein-tyrosine kinase